GTGTTQVTAIFNNTGAVLVLSGTLELAGGGVAGGFFDVAAGAVLASTAGTLTLEGYLSGAGTVRVGNGNGTLVNAGTVSPGGGGAAGTLTVAGNYRQGGTGVLTIELGGAASDQLQVTGTANLNGVLSVLLLDDFFAEAGYEFRVLDARSRAGEFA